MRLRIVRFLLLTMMSFGLVSTAIAQEDDPYRRLFEFAKSFPKEHILYVSKRPYTGDFIGKKMRIFVDDGRSPEIEAVRGMLGEASAFSPFDIPYFGPTRAAIWSLFVVHNYEDRPLTLYFENDYNVAQHISFTAIGENGVLHRKKAGNAEPFGARDKLTRSDVFTETVAPGYTVFLVSSWGDVSQQIPLRLWTPDEFYHNELKRRTFIDIISGCALALLLYNIFLFFSLRDPIYFFYSLYVLSNIAFHGTEHGFLREFFYYNLKLEAMPSWLNVVMVECIVLTAYGFAQRFAAISFRSRLGKVYLVFMIVALLDILNAFFLSPTLSLYIAAGSASVAFCLFIYTGFRIFNEAESQVRLYLLAWAFYILGSSGAILNYLGLIERSSVTKYGLIIGNMVEMILLSLVLANRIKRIQSDLQMEQQKKFHSYEQLEKVFYPHQLEMIKNGNPLENTMPTHPAEACVICFDVARSSQIRHEKAKEFLRRIFQRCNRAMMDGYDRHEMRANAYRIKEMGDGFLCSVGYPFGSATGHIAQDAVALALKFYEIFCEEAAALDYEDDLHCGIGLAMGDIVGFFPESGTKEYDLYGKAIILATRYESMRKVILKEARSASLLILQEQVYLSLPEGERDRFQNYDLVANEAVVRDDSDAQTLFYQVLVA